MTIVMIALGFVLFCWAVADRRLVRQYRRAMRPWAWGLVILVYGLLAYAIWGPQAPS